MNFTRESFDAAQEMRLQSYGYENPNIYFYVIYRNGTGSGFFSNLFHVLGHIGMAKKFGMIPVVDMENFHTFYNERDPICGTNNSWEYYFKQPSEYSLVDVYRSKNVFFCSGQFLYEIYDSNKKAFQILNEYIHVNKHIEDDVHRYYCENFLGKKVLGVHFRGQEMNRTANHPIGPKTEQMISKSRELLDRFSIDKIFVVSEEQSYLDAFQHEFGDMVLATDAFRTYETNAYCIRPYPRPLHMYKLGLDILKESLLLSKTNYLLASGSDGIASGSNVSRMAQLFNCEKYEHVELIYNGMNPPSLGDRFPVLRRGKRALRYIVTGKRIQY